jgi:RimJ/RimL family protein N-acetyltransferase
MMERDLSSWRGCAGPSLECAEGRYAHLARFDRTQHAAALFAAVCGPQNEPLYRYLPHGNFASPSALADFLDSRRDAERWLTLVIAAPAGAIVGMASYMRVRPEHGSAEVGCVLFSPMLQRTPAATDAMRLMARHVFDDLGYRRYEWKCNAANAPSRRAAERLGFVHEGCFRQDMVAQGKSRDTDWYSMLDSEWPQVRRALDAWLDPANFGDDGRQIATLQSLRT